MNATMSLTAKPRREPEKFIEPEKPRYPKTIEEFLSWKPEDGFKYEWNDGVLEKTPKMITFKTLYIVETLNWHFFHLLPKLPQRGCLFTEPQANTSIKQVRVPDMAYYTSAQIGEAAKGGTPVPGFAIELVSDNDLYKHVFGKLEEYFRAGVQIVWIIDPFLKKVNVFTAPDQVSICSGARLCSAEPVIPGYVISVDDIFKEP